MYIMVDSSFSWSICCSKGRDSRGAGTLHMHMDGCIAVCTVSAGTWWLAACKANSAGASLSNSSVRMCQDQSMKPDTRICCVRSRARWACWQTWQPALSATPSGMPRRRRTPRSAALLPKVAYGCISVGGQLALHGIGMLATAGACTCMLRHAIGPLAGEVLGPISRALPVGTSPQTWRHAWAQAPSVHAAAASWPPKATRAAARPPTTRPPTSSAPAAAMAARPRALAVRSALHA